MNKVTVVFPMAGESQRFGGKFKPFFKIFDKTFIELAVQPFLKHKDRIKDFVFIVRKDHLIQFNVEERFRSFNIPANLQIVPIQPTKSPVETISALFEHQDVLNDVIFCDCDHSLNVDGIFKDIDKGKFNCIVPVYNISESEINKWSVVRVDDNNMVRSISEKSKPNMVEKTLSYGVIGCYYFSKLFKPTHDMKYISDIIADGINIQYHKTKAVEVKEAEFFGDPERLKNMYEEKKASTIFCDLDGTVIKHENIPDYTKDIEFLEGAREKIDEWRKDNNCFIVLTTSRDEQFRPELEYMLRKAGVRYEHLVMGLPSGTRYLINDKKPYSEKPMAMAHEVKRDEGIKDIALGHSEAKLSYHNDIVLKYLPKDATEYQKVKFKAQYESMKAVSDSKLHYLVPKIGEFKEDSYVMEKLSGYKPLHLLSIQDRVLALNELFDCLSKWYDSGNKSLIISYWLHDYLSEKIFSKKDKLHEIGLGNETDEILTILRTSVRIHDLSPTISYQNYHGDLTYENVLVNKFSVKMIDFDNDNKAGVVEQDLGKLMQSYLTKYEFWDSETAPEYSELEFDMIIDFYTKILGQDRELVIRKAYFYCALHLYRMIPYQAQFGLVRPTMAIKLCKQYLKKSLDEIKHFYEPITGWFTFPRFYKDIVQSLPNGSNVVEVGVYEGKSLAYFMVEMLRANKSFNVYAVDSFTFNDEQTNENIEVVFRRNLASVIDKVNVIKGDSGLSAEQFEDESIDFLFLDADHVKSRVYSDIRAWLPKIKKNGIISGHDYCEAHEGVIEAVDEIFGFDMDRKYLDELVWVYKNK